MKKAYIVLGDRFGEKSVLGRYGYEVVRNMEDADFVVFTGGEDINPALYNEGPHPSVYYNDRRDAAEIKEYTKAVGLSLPMLGICRGAQLLNVLIGGTLYQDVNNHGRTHSVITDDGEVFLTTSVHHQMMRVTENAIIKAWSTGQSSSRKFMEDGDLVIHVGIHEDPEIVIYPDQRMLLVQGHPEFSSHDPDCEQFRQYVFKLLNSL